VAAKDIYNPNVTKTMKVEEFKQIQQSNTTQTTFYLKETWLTKLKDIIKNRFAEQPENSGFRLDVTDKSKYEGSDLHRFLVQQRFIMENTMLDLTRNSVERYVDCILSFLPISTTVKTESDVENVYYTPE